MKRDLVRTLGRVLFVLEALLGLAHLRWPELEWGQGRDSYFNLGNRLTLASWLAAMQLVAVAGLCMFMFHRAAPQRADAPRGVWRLGAIAALLLSLHEITRFVERFGWLGGQQPDPFERMIPGMGGLIVVALFGVSLRRRLVGRARALITGWLGLWALERVLVTLPIEGVYVGLARGLAWLAGGTLLLLALLEHASRHRADARPPAHDLASAPRPRSASALELVGVGGTTFCLIALQIVLFQLLTISGDYLLANSVISIALLGLALGGLIGFSAASRAPRQAVLTASFLLPAAVLLAFGVSASMMGSPLLASALLAVPFTLCSAVITVKLVEADTHTVYFFDLAGAALGALVVAPGFGLLREEGSMLLLAALAFLVALLFARTEPRGPSRAGLSALALLGALALTAATVANARVDALNVVRERVLKDYPRAELLFSRSSFAGRYDVVRRRPSSEALKSLENGHTIDTIRPDPPARYQIDPRVPHTLMPDPVVLILGVSGDAITKTARQLASVVYGVEINPVVVELQRGPLAPLNGDSYDGIDVEPVDGRSYLERYPERRYDMITLLNAHFARGRAGGRAPCPEYLHTQDAFARYLDQLTDRGVVILEEPVTRPEREVAIWKLLETMRAALLERGAARPDEHFFVFQWNTRTNNYVQILMKKTPFTPEELARLEDWLAQVNSLPALERERGQSLGPIDTAACTTLFAPHQPDGDDFQNTYATILRGQTDPRLRRARRLTPTRDDRPFPFDTDPARPAVRAACARALALLLCLLPAFWALLRRVSSRAGVVAPYALVVALTGVGYFLVEVVLIQRHEFLLGSPVVTFSTVLGSLLAFSGLGSLWSRRLSTRGLLWALGAVIALLGAHLLWPVPALLNAAHGLALPLKVLLSVSAIAPLAFFMGAPFPTIMRLGKRRFTPAGAAALFAVNAAASAVAVPVTMALSMNYGFSTTFALGALAYALVGALALTLGRERGAPLITTLAAAALAVFLLSPWLPANTSPAPTPAPASAAPQLRVHAIEYGSSRFKRSKIVSGGDDTRERVSWMVWLVSGGGLRVLVDTGFHDEALRREWGVHDYARPTDRLRELGVSPDEITDVVLTHAHWDHVGDVAAYPQARVWIQRAEVEHMRAQLVDARPDAAMTKGMRRADLEALARIEGEGRLRLLDGAHELAPGVRLEPGGAHTPGSQWVEVDALDGRVILAGDAAYRYESVFRQRPTGSNIDDALSRAALRRMYRRAASPFYVIPGHERDVIRRFPEVAPGVVEIAAIGGRAP